VSQGHGLYRQEPRRMGTETVSASTRALARVDDDEARFLPAPRSVGSTRSLPIWLSPCAWPG